MTQRNVLTCTRHNHEYPGDHCCIIIIIYFPQIHGLYHKHNRIKQEHKDRNKIFSQHPNYNVIISM